MIKVLSTEQLLDHAIAVIEEITTLQKKPELSELLKEKCSELSKLSKELDERRNMTGTNYKNGAVA